MSQQQKHTDVISGLFFFLEKKQKDIEFGLLFGEEVEGNHIWSLERKQKDVISGIFNGEEAERLQIWSLEKKQNDLISGLSYREEEKYIKICLFYLEKAERFQISSFL